MMNNITYNSKDEYINITTAWRQFVNSGQAKKQKSRDSWDTNKYSPLQSQFHLLYSLLRNKGYDGFVEDSEGLDEAKTKLKFLGISQVQSIFGSSVSEELLKQVQESIN